MRSLTLIEPVIFAALKGSPTFEISVAAYRNYESIHESGDAARAAQVFTEEWGNGTKWADLPERQRDYIIDRLPLIFSGYTQQYEDVAGLTAPGLLEAIDCPVLLMRGADSPAAVAAINAALSRRIGAAEMVFPGASHMLPITHPEPVAAAIRKFLSL